MTVPLPAWYEKLAPEARAALQRARDESERADLAYIGTEQLLLGLLGQRRGVVRRALRGFGLELDEVRSPLVQLRVISAEHSASTTAPPPSELTLSVDAKRAIELGVEHARTANQSAIGSEHLLLGLLGLDRGTAIDFLRVRGLDLDALRARTRQLATRAPRAPTRRLLIYQDVAALEGGLSVSGGGPRSNVVMCRLEDRALEAIDMLIEAGVRANRSDAAAWLINVGLESKTAVVEAVKDKVADIRRLRESARALAEGAGANA